MATVNPRSTAQIAGHPIHPMVIAFPIACFVLAFVSDLAFAATSNGFWATASLWLLGIGLITAGLAAVTGLVEVWGDTRVRNLSDTRLHAIGAARWCFATGSESRTKNEPGFPTSLCRSVQCNRPPCWRPTLTRGWDTRSRKEDALKAAHTAYN